MIEFIFTDKAKAKFKRFNLSEQERIIEKLTGLKNHRNIFTILKKLTLFKYATHRLRIGHYRALLLLSEQDKTNIEFLVVDIGHRKNIYKNF
ncbi:MAG: hypothetical protein Q8P62_01295 [Candidatus Peregrinibacteria bacterium]|nr:hypothetical protein [Candidatus Peregrinibacteria bacterium]